MYQPTKKEIAALQRLQRRLGRSPEYSQPVVDFCVFCAQGNYKAREGAGGFFVVKNTAREYAEYIEFRLDKAELTRAAGGDFLLDLYVDNRGLLHENLNESQAEHIKEKHGARLELTEDKAIFERFE